MSELGNKHECLGCSTKFYDLGRNELVCPKCGENQKDLAAAQEDSAGKNKSRKKPAKRKAKAKKKAKVDSDDTDDLATNKDEDESQEKSDDEEE